jgi:hypothetical protein
MSANAEYVIGVGTSPPDGVRAPPVQSCDDRAWHEEVPTPVILIDAVRNDPELRKVLLQALIGAT